MTQKRVTVKVWTMPIELRYASQAATKMRNDLRHAHSATREVEQARMLCTAWARAREAAKHIEDYMARLGYPEGYCRGKEEVSH